MTEGMADATVQIGRACAAILIGAWTRAESLSCRASRATGCQPSDAEGSVIRRVARGDLRLINQGESGIEGLLRVIDANLTIPLLGGPRRGRVFGHGDVDGCGDVRATKQIIE